MPNPRWGNVSYKKKVLSEDTWDPELERQVYDQSFYQNDAVEIKAATPFVRRFFLRELPPWDSCCDLGCGLGLWMSALLGDGKDVMGIDFSPGAQAANALGERYINADLTRPLNLKRAYDVVTCWEVFEHLPKQLHHDLMMNIIDLDPGILIMSCAGMKVTGADTGELDPPLEKQKGRHHYSCMPLRDFAATVIRYGFQVDGLLSVLWRQVPKLPNHYRNNTLIFSRNRE